MRLIPQWLWKLIPHRHADKMLGGFTIGRDVISEIEWHECARCGRYLIVRRSGLGTDWWKAQGKVQLDAIQDLVKKVNPDWEYVEVKPRYEGERDKDITPLGGRPRAMRLIPCWLWKWMPHRHIDKMIDTFVISSSVKYPVVECIRCGRTWLG